MSFLLSLCLLEWQHVHFCLRVTSETSLAHNSQCLLLAIWVCSWGVGLFVWCMLEGITLQWNPQNKTAQPSLFWVLAKDYVLYISPNKSMHISYCSLQEKKNILYFPCQSLFRLHYRVIEGLLLTALEERGLGEVMDALGLCMVADEILSWLVVWNIVFFPYIGNVIIPIDFFRGVAQPPTNQYQSCNELCITEAYLIEHVISP